MQLELSTDRKNGLPISETSEVFDIFAELEQEMRRSTGIPENGKQGDTSLDDLIFVEDSAPPSAERSFFGDDFFDDSKDS
jgi:hypothetical protein